MTRIFNSAVIFLMISFFSCVSHQDYLLGKLDASSEKVDVDTKAFQKTIADLSRLVESLELPKHLEKEDAVRENSDFDINSYFKILTHLSMEENYVLDYAYYSNFLGGEPYIYARKKESKPFGSYSEYIDTIKKEANIDEVKIIKDEISKTVKEFDEELPTLILPEETIKTEGDEKELPSTWSANEIDKLNKKIKKLEGELEKFPRRKYWQWYLEHIKIDGSKLSYLELLLLKQKGNQFYLRWHGGYNDTEIVCSKADAIRIIKENNIEAYTEDDSGEITDISIGRISIAAIKEIDFSPKVISRDETADVSIVTFTKWGGFYRKNFTISKKFPNKITEKENELLIKYDCGIFF